MRKDLAGWFGSCVFYGVADYPLSSVAVDTACVAFQIQHSAAPGLLFVGNLAFQKQEWRLHADCYSNSTLERSIMTSRGNATTMRTGPSGRCLLQPGLLLVLQCCRRSSLCRLPGPELTEPRAAYLGESTFRRQRQHDADRYIHRTLEHSRMASRRNEVSAWKYDAVSLPLLA